MRKKLHAAMAATVTAAMALAGSAFWLPAEAATGDPVLLNEVLASTTSTDSEYVELYGTPGTSLAGLSVIVTESDDQHDNGAIDSRFDLPAGAVIGDNGFYLLGNDQAASTYGVTPDFTLDDSLENSSVTVALVETATITGAAVDSGTVALDTVGLSDGETQGSFHFDAPVVGPDGSYLPAGAGRVKDGVDTDTADDWFILDFNNDASVNTPTPAAAKGGGGPDTDKPTKRYIHEVQGAGAESPLAGDRVVVEGVVVGDEEGGWPHLGGFFVQEEDKHADDDPATSEGVFVYTDGADLVDLGDAVEVEGTVEERFDNTQLTEVMVTVHKKAKGPATAAVVKFPLTATSDLEAVEGMAASFPQDLVITEYFNYDRFGEVVVGLPMPGEDRPFTPTAVADPGSPEAVERRDWNLLSRITIDDGLTAQNPDQVVHPINREPFTLENRFRGGDQVSGLVGPIYFDFGLYRLLPTGFDSYERTERPESPEEVGGNLRVASMNALNYFLTLDDGDPHCGPDGDMDCRGANTEQELERQRAKLLQALAGLDADVIGLNELENTRGVFPLADIVAGLNEMTSAGTFDYVRAGEDGVVGTDAIKVGVIYRTDRVTQLGNAAVLDSQEFLDPLDTGGDKNRAAVAASFLEKGTGEKFSVVVNHLKSKGSGCGAGDDDEWAGSCNATRTAAAGVLADWIGTDPTNANDSDWMILGDLNSYDHEDPIKALEAEGYTDLVREHVGELAYSYVFDGQWGYLDYAMSNESLTSQVTGATEWHINSPEPDILDYDMSFKSDTQDALYDGSTPYRSSDHDAVLVGLDLG